MNWSVQVREIMTPDPISVDIDDSPSAVKSMLDSASFHHLPVLRGGVLVGVVSPVDLARISLDAWIGDAKADNTQIDVHFKLSDIMTWEPAHIRASDPVKLAADHLSSGEFHSLPVLDDDDTLIGILTSTDLLRWIVNA